jgi:hypothetical protein
MYDTNPNPNPLFGLSDAGCHADGAFGHEHVRDRIAGLLLLLHPAGEDGPHGELIAALAGEPSDDAYEESEALDRLNAACSRAVYWELDAGDLLLVPFGGEA